MSWHAGLIRKWPVTMQFNVMMEWLCVYLVASAGGEMAVSDMAGRELPEDDALAQCGWWPGGPLTRLEREMLSKAEAGELLDLGKGPFKLEEMKAWGRSRTIRAEVLQHLLVSQTGRVHPKGVRLRGLRISGRLDLESAILRCPLRMEDCYFSNRGSIKLDYATVPLLALSGCHLPGLTGDTLVVNKDFQLEGSTCTGPVHLPDANIAGVLSFRDTHLEASHRPYALAAWRMKVGGSVFLDGGFTAAGAVCLSDVSIASHLSFSGATLKGFDSGGNALLGDGITVGGNVFLDGVTAAGAVWLTDASITGYLSCGRAKLSAADGKGGPASDGHALTAWRMKVRGGVYLNEKCAIAGQVSLAAADITGDLNCSGAVLSGAAGGGYALDGYEMKVSGDVILEEKFTAAGVSLAAADVAGSLRCSSAVLSGAGGDGYALSADRIKVGGSVYLNERFSAVGSVRLFGADITGQLNCNSARLAGSRNDGYALEADLIKVGGAVLLCEGFTAAGTVRLDDADITSRLDCNDALLTGEGQDGALHADGIKAGGGVYLSGRFTATGAIRLRSANITGTLSCAGAVMVGADTDGKTLNAGGAKVSGDAFFSRGFTAAGTLWLLGADIGGQLNCSGGALLACVQAGGNALVADGIKAGGVYLNGGFRSAGAVRLPNADITGNLDCSGAQLTGGDGYALVADGMKASGDVFLTSGFRSTGAIRLPGANITGQLSCSEAQLTGADGDGHALIAEGITVGSHLFLDRVSAAGTVRLFNAGIAGQLTCSGAVLVGAGADGNALLADGMKVGGDVFLDDGCIADGTVSLISARIDGSLVLMPMKLADRIGITALNATGAQIAHKLVWQPAQQVSGLVILEDATVGQVDDSWGSALDSRLNGYWPLASHGLLRLDGFTYNRIGGNQPASLDDRLRWIGSQPKPPWKKRAVSVMRGPWSEMKNRRHRRLVRAGYGFSPQPYEQLVQVYQETGHPTEARTVALARRRDLRLYGHPTPYRRALDWLLDKTINYGYQTWRAVLGIAVLYGVVLALFWYAQHRTGLIVPVQSIQGLQPKPTAATCASDYPCFSPVGYAIDTVIPLVNVHQATYWGPNASAPFGWFFVWVSWAGIVLGWLLATLAVAGYTGLVRSTDAL